MGSVVFNVGGLNCREVFVISLIHLRTTIGAQGE